MGVAALVLLDRFGMALCAVSFGHGRRIRADLGRKDGTAELDKAKRMRRLQMDFYEAMILAARYL